MPLGRKRRRPVLALGSASALALGTLALLAISPAARAASAPSIEEAWVAQVSSGAARVEAKVNPNGAATTYRVEYLTAAAYEANLAASKEGFAGALRSPTTFEVGLGAGTAAIGVFQQLFSLAPGTAYRYRFVAHSSQGTVQSAALAFTTQSTGGGALLADSRGWEMVSPVDKNGGDVSTPGQAAGGSFQAAADGQSFAYGSPAAFGQGAQGAPPISQYLASRGPASWASENLSAPLFSGTYEFESAGDPYLLFSADLARGLLFNGAHCRGAGVSGCAVSNPPLPGTEAPAGYEEFYMREGGAFTALLGDASAGFLGLEPKAFDLAFAGASPDLRHVVLSSCAALTANATEAPAGEGCDAEKPNLYKWSGANLILLNVPPAETQGTPGAALAAPTGAISQDGQRVYFTDEGALYLREGSTTKLLEAGASFQTASADGSVAFYTKATHLYRYQAAGAGTVTDLTPSGGVVGVLGASESADAAYYLDAAGIERWHAGTTTLIAAGAGAAATSDYPPAAATARVSADGTRLLFLSKAPLTGYDNIDQGSGEADSEVFLYAAGLGLACVSCNPTSARPVGPSTIPGAVLNGGAVYRPRALATDGKRAFFDSEDALVATDTDNAPDVYEWEAQGEGSCTRAGGCVTLISSGRSDLGATFVDASADGSDAFFLTAASLVGADPGGVDLYDARAGGGFAEPNAPISCEGDACQPLPSPPADPTLTTLLSGPGNPGVRYPGAKCKKGKRGKCAKAGHHKKQKRRPQRGRAR